MRQSTQARAQTPGQDAPSAGRAVSGWRARLVRDPVPDLLRQGSPALVARLRRDLIGDDEAPGPAEVVAYPEVRALLRQQDRDGAIPPHGPDRQLGGPRFARCLATLRALDRLIDLGVGPEHPAVVAAADCLLASQRADGGIADLALAATRGGRPRTVALHFQGWALAALCRAGLDADSRVGRGFDHLLSERQADGGWAWRGVRTDSAARPASHLVTGMVLRAFGASASRHASGEARRAAELLATRFMQPDRYPDRKAAAYWELLSEPRFWTDILDALDGVTAVGLGKENSGVRTAEAYVRSRQALDGFWYPGRPGRGAPTASAAEKAAARWLTVRALVILRRLN